MRNTSKYSVVILAVTNPVCSRSFISTVPNSAFQKTYIYSLERQSYTKRGRWRGPPPSASLPKWPQWQWRSQTKARRPELLLGLPGGSIFCHFLRFIGRELHRKWSSEDSNQPHTGRWRRWRGVDLLCCSPGLQTLPSNTARSDHSLTLSSKFSEIPTF